MGKQTSKVMEVEMVDFKYLAQVTSYSEGKLRVWHKAFLKDCPRGVLTLQEFSRLYHKLYPRSDTSFFVEHLFRVADANQDGGVDFGELMTAVSAICGGSVDDKLRWMFNLFDFDNDGFISKQDIFLIVTSLQKRKRQRLSSEAEMTATTVSDIMFMLLDTDRKGVITVEEFVKGARHAKSIGNIFSFI